VTWRKGLKALHTPCCRCVCVITSSGPCRMTGDHSDPGMGAISRMQVVVHCERISPSTCARWNGRAFASLTARGGGLPVGVTVNTRHICGQVQICNTTGSLKHFSHRPTGLALPSAPRAARPPTRAARSKAERGAARSGHAAQDGIG
jgi:hypothetical protein